MGEYSEKILLSVQIENTEAAKRLVEVKNTLVEVKKAQKDATDPAEMVKYEAQIRALNIEQRKLQKTIDDTAKSQRSAIGSNDEMRASLSVLTLEWNALGDAEKKNTQEGRLLEAEIKAISDALKENESAVGDNRRNVDNYAETVEGLRQQLKELNATIEGLPLGSDQLEAAKMEAAGLRNEIDLALGKVDEFGNREPKNLVKKGYEDAAEAAAGLTSGIALLNIAYADSENLQEIQAQSLQAIAIAQNVANVAKSAGAIIDTAAAVRTKALAVQQAFLALVTGTSTGALRTFKIALASTGVGAIVILLGELIFNFDEVNKRVNQFVNFQKDLIKEVTGGNEVLADMFEIFQYIVNPMLGVIKLVGVLKEEFGPEFNVDVEALTKTYEKFGEEMDRQLKPMADQIRLRKAQGATESEIADLTKKKLAEEVAYRKIANDRAHQLQAEFLKRGQQFSDEQAKLFNQVTDAYKESQVNQAVFDAETAKAQSDRAKDRQNELRAEAKIRIELLLTLQQDEENARIEAITNTEQREIAAAKLAADRQKDALNNEIVNIKGTDAQKELLYQEFANRVETIEADLQNKIIDIQEKSQQEKDEKAKASFEKQYLDQIQEIQRITDVREREASLEIKSAKALEEEKLRIKLKAFEEQLKLTSDFLGSDGLITLQEKAILDEIALKIKEIKAQVSAKESNVTFGESIGLTAEQTKEIQEGLQSIQQGFNAIAAAVNASYEVRLNNIEAEKNAEAEAIESSLLSEEEKKDKLTALDKKYAGEQYEIEKKQFETNKALQIVNALIAGALGVVSAFQLGPIAGAIAAVAIAITTAAQVAVIASQAPPKKPSFFGGGFTEQSGNPYAVSSYSNGYRDLHHNEYVAPKKVLDLPQAWPHINALESMRLKTPGRLGLPGYADGGFAAQRTINVASVNINADELANATASAISRLNIVTRISDIEKVGGEVVLNRVSSEL